MDGSRKKNRDKAMDRSRSRICLNRGMCLNPGCKKVHMWSKIITQAEVDAANEAAEAEAMRANDKAEQPKQQQQQQP